MILLINPWVHDYTSYDLWAKPLGLIEIYSWLKENNINSQIIDFMYQYYPEIPDSRSNEIEKKSSGKASFLREEIEKPDPLKSITISRKFYRFGLSKKIVSEKLKSVEKPDLILVTSVMTYWYTGVKETVDFLKKYYPDVPVVLGGIYIKLLKNHAMENINADYFIEKNEYTNLKYLINKTTGKNLELPECRFNINLSYDQYPDIPYYPLRFSIGCPYKCPYCCSNYLEPKYFDNKLENIKKEFIKYYNNGIKDFAFYDDALLVNKEKIFKPFFSWLIENDINARFHTPNAVHINLFDEEIAILMKKANFTTIRFGFETAFRKEFIENKTSRKNLENTVKYIKKAGIDRTNIRIYLIAGMPNQTFEDVKESITYVQSLGVIPIPNEYSPVPKTQMFKDAILQSGFDIKNEPLYHNKSIVPCQWEHLTYSDLQKLKQISRHDIF